MHGVLTLLMTSCISLDSYTFHFSNLYYVASPYSYLFKCERATGSRLAAEIIIDNATSRVYHFTFLYPVREPRTNIRRFYSHQIWKMDPNDLTSPNAVAQNLHRVSGVLQDMKDRDNATKNFLAVPMSPGIPPAAFGAGGKM